VTTHDPPPAATLHAVSWPEIGAGDDLVRLLAAIDGLCDGDIVLVTSKVVSKAEGRLVYEDRQAVIGRETRRVVARRGATVVAETGHGLVLAAAGVDASNTPVGTALTLPVDPDGSARMLRTGVYEAIGTNIAVVVTDTAGRAWRLGQTDLAVGCAGMLPLVDLAGTRDSYGNELLVTAPAVADELAAAADLVKGKTNGRPVAVVRGLGTLVLPPDEHGPGAVTLVRPAADDLFGLGSRDAVVAAAHRRDPDVLEHFPRWAPTDPDPFAELVAGWRESTGAPAEAAQVEIRRDACATGASTASWMLEVDVPDDADQATLLAVGRLLERAETLAAAFHLRAHRHDQHTSAPASRPIARICWQDR
jgi:coenzyme F420-0:L-glutamate ligase / coenzyme F420-1:gamma-L-glutamate ligase